MIIIARIIIAFMLLLGGFMLLGCNLLSLLLLICIAHYAANVMVADIQLLERRYLLDHLIIRITRLLILRLLHVVVTSTACLGLGGALVRTWIAARFHR